MSLRERFSNAKRLQRAADKIQEGWKPALRDTPLQRFGAFVASLFASKKEMAKVLAANEYLAG